MSNPQTTIHICSGVRLNNDYQHTIWFGSQTEQLNYFSSKVVKTYNNYTYVRRSWTLKVDATMEQARTWNYLYFRNDTGKRYFYFINNIEYVNDNTVELFLEMDVLQTYLTDYQLSDCFVEREHSSTDEIGDNLIDEGLDVGEYLDVNYTNVTDLNSLCILVLSSINIASSTEDVQIKLMGGSYDNVFSGLGLYACAMSQYSDLAQCLSNLDLWGYSDCVFNVWMYPKNLVKLRSGYSWTDDQLVKPVSDTEPLEFVTSRPDTLSMMYEPNNKKLYTYPYNFLYVHNNSGGSATSKYEYFNDPENIKFNIYGSLSPEGVTKLTPVGYKHSSKVNFDESLSGSPYPCCAWNQDTYKLWLAQTQNSRNLNMLTSGASILAGAGMMVAGVPSGAGMVGGGLFGVANQLAQKKDKAIQPPQAKGQHSGSLNIANGFQTFTFIQKCIDTEHLLNIDDFFTMYGYKTLRVKKPNRNVRENFTYTKTVNCHVRGNLCTSDLRKIQSIYDNGITFWVNGDSIGNYSLSNKCL